MTTTLIKFNADGACLELVVVPTQGPRLSIIKPDGTVAYFRRYEYWEVSLATGDYLALVTFMEPGEVRSEEAVSGGDRRKRRTHRVHHPRKDTAGREREGAETGAA